MLDSIRFHFAIRAPWREHPIISLRGPADETLISADSHIVEPPNCYVDFIEPKYRAAAPRIEKTSTASIPSSSKA